MPKTYAQSVPFEDRLQNAEASSRGYGLAPITYTAARIIGPDDIGRTIIVTSGSGVAVTLPKDSDDTRIPIGASGAVIAGGAGQVTMTAGSGATLRLSGLTAKSLQQYSKIRWEKIAANTYSIEGNVAAS